MEKEPCTNGQANELFKIYAEYIDISDRTSSKILKIESLSRRSSYYHSSQ